MPCDYSSPEIMAEQGWTNEEIELLEKEIELARQKAKKESFEQGDNLAQQEFRMQEAEDGARLVAHDRFHARLEKLMYDIKQMSEWKKKHPNSHFSSNKVAVPEKLPN